jgi:prepilin-type processing-associated H-X9-DG protein
VELLVVIAIISVLAGMLLPAFQGALEEAYMIKCNNGVRQAYLAHNFYMNDCDGILLASGNISQGDGWYDRLVRNQYATESMFTSAGGCPYAPEAYQLNDNFNAFYAHKDPAMHTSYAINITLTGEIDATTKAWGVKVRYPVETLPHARITTFKRCERYPGDVMLFMCSTTGQAWRFQWNTLYAYHNTLGYRTNHVYQPDILEKYKRHDGKALPFAFVDGHVEPIGDPGCDPDDYTPYGEFMPNYVHWWKADTDREVRWKSIALPWARVSKKNYLHQGGHCPDLD